MNYMHRKMHREARLLRTRIDSDPSGMVFVECAEPKLLLSLLGGEDIQQRIEEGIKGVFRLDFDRQVEVYFAGEEQGQLVWAVIGADERVSDRAA